MASINLQELTIAQAHTSFRRGDYTAEQLVTTYLQRIQEIDRDQNGPKLNSLLALNPNAVLEARKLDDVFKVTSQFIGPLHGIPIVIKDQAETKGIPTTFGSVAAKDFKSSQDANLVKKLRNAGAIILAKSTMPGMFWLTALSLVDKAHSTMHRLGFRFLFDINRIRLYAQSVCSRSGPWRLQQRYSSSNCREFGIDWYRGRYIRLDPGSSVILQPRGL